MKYTQSIALALLMICASSGCATNYTADRVLVDVWKGGGSITIRSRKISDSEYLISANGAAANNDSEIKEAWEEFAIKVASGRPYQKELVMENYEYSDMGIRFRSRRAVGRIVLRPTGEGAEPSATDNPDDAQRLRDDH